MKYALILLLSMMAWSVQAQNCIVIQPKQLEILDGIYSPDETSIAVGTKHLTGTIETVQGFRIQIYNGENKKEALATKAAFNGKFRNTNSYYHYVAPNYKINVGDYVTKVEALQALKEIKRYFSNALIVPSKVTKKDLNLE